MTRPAFRVLAGANFAIALGYGAVMPLLPTLLGELGGGSAPRSEASHTGALLASYMLGLFVTAPLWGVVADRFGGRRVMLFGLVGYALAVIAFALADSLAAAYGWRVLAGVAGGAVLPVVSASIGAEPDRELRARRFAAASMATLLGLLAGPAASGIVYAAMERMGDAGKMTAVVVGLPLGVVAAVTLVVAAAVGAARGEDAIPSVREAYRVPSKARVDWGKAAPMLFASFLVLAGLGAFEAMLPVLGRDALSLDPSTLGGLFALCMAVMLAVEAGLFLAPVLHRIAHGSFLAAAFVVLAGGVGLLAQATSLAGAVLAVGLIGAGGAALQPAIAYLATVTDGGASGTLLGALTGAGSLGQALGSLAGGTLFAAFDANGLWVVAAGLAGGAVWIGLSDRAVVPPVPQAAGPQKPQERKTRSIAS